MTDEDDETLGECEVRGLIQPELAAQLEESCGPDWRKLTRREAIAINVEAADRARESQAVALRRAAEARARNEIREALLRHAEAGAPLNDTLARDTRLAVATVPAERGPRRWLAVVELRGDGADQWRNLYRRRSAVEREFGRLKHHYALAMLRASVASSASGYTPI